MKTMTEKHRAPDAAEGRALLGPGVYVPLVLVVLLALLLLFLELGPL